MTQKNPLFYLDTHRSDPQKTYGAERIKDFKEIYGDFTKTEAMQQAARCLSCGNPYCEWKCPLHNYIPNWLDMIHEGKLFEAAELSHRTNPIPEICGRVCPQDRLCEGSCTLNDEFGAVTIGAIERYITDNALEQGWRPNLTGIRMQDKKVAIIGAGPAGISCADRLARAGVKAVVYDRYSEIGGLLTFGIPEFKLEKSVITTRRQVLEEMGVEFRLNTNIDSKDDFAALMEDFDAIFLAIGAYKEVRAGIKGEDHAHVYSALPFLIGNTANLHGFKTAHPFIDLQQRNVIVLGGGDTAMDCTRTSIRQGASSVICAYRRTEADMPGSKREVINAKEENVQFAFNLQPTEIISDEAGITAVKFDITGDIKKFKPHLKAQMIDDHSLTLPCDAVITAFGFKPNVPEFLASFDIDCNDQGRILVDQKLPYQSRNQKIFSGGDCVRGADLVVTAAYDGREAAHNILHFLHDCD